MEIRDVVHGAIALDKHEQPVIDSRYFQRLRQIKQLGFGEYSFPSATHNRYIHSLGAMETATQAFDTIFGGPRGRGANRQSNAGGGLDLFRGKPQAHASFRALLRLAALLHDVGHGPLSHTTEIAMPQVKDLNLPLLFDSGGPTGDVCPIPDRKATHEDYTLKLILDSGLTPFLEKAGAPYGFKPRHIASLIEPQLSPGDQYFFETVDGVSVDFRPILQQLISSELDADRMDYLRRDSMHAGVSYGQFDFDWLVGNLTAHIAPAPNTGAPSCFLSLSHRALYSFEDFLISRFHMFLMVYFHYKSVVFDEMLSQFFVSPDCDYKLPADIEEYCLCNDDHLYAHLAKSQNPWAKRIAEKRPYRMLVELHSGIPSGPQTAAEQEAIRQAIVKDLNARGIHRIETTSTGELSKYFRKPGNPIFVRYDNQYTAARTLRLEQCTDLFERYSTKRVISRIYVAPEHYNECRERGKNV